MDVPNPTLYVSNMYEKLKPEFAMAQLKSIFSQHGKIQKIHISRKLVSRGQVRLSSACQINAWTRL